MIIKGHVAKFFTRLVLVRVEEVLYLSEIIILSTGCTEYERNNKSLHSKKTRF